MAALESCEHDAPDFVQMGAKLGGLQFLFDFMSAVGCLLELVLDNRNAVHEQVLFLATSKIKCRCGRLKANCDVPSNWSAPARRSFGKRGLLLDHGALEEEGLPDTPEISAIFKEPFPATVPGDADVMIRTEVRQSEDANGQPSASVHCGACFRHFFAPRWWVSFCNSLIWQIECPLNNEGFLRVVALQFPNLNLMLNRVFQMESAELVDGFLDENGERSNPPATCTRGLTSYRKIDLKLPINHRAMKKYYPAVSTFLKWLVTLDIDVVDLDNPEKKIANVQFDATKQVWMTEGLSTDGGLAWVCRKTGLPIDGEPPFNFDLSSERPLAFLMGMRMPVVMGFTYIQLPTVTISVTCHNHMMDIRLVHVNLAEMMAPARLFNWMFDLPACIAKLMETFHVQVNIPLNREDLSPSTDVDSSSDTDDVFLDARDDESVVLQDDEDVNDAIKNTADTDKRNEVEISGAGEFVDPQALPDPSATLVTHFWMYTLLFLEVPTMFLVNVFKYIWDYFIKKGTYLELFELLRDVVSALVTDLHFHLLVRGNAGWPAPTTEQ